LRTAEEDTPKQGQAQTGKNKNKNIGPRLFYFLCVPWKNGSHSISPVCAKVMTHRHDFVQTHMNIHFLSLLKNENT
jgi:hypothetical protein